MEKYFVKSVKCRSFLWSVFSSIPTEYEDLHYKSPYTVQIREKPTRKKSEFGHFSCTERGVTIAVNKFHE